MPSEVISLKLSSLLFLVLASPNPKLTQRDVSALNIKAYGFNRQVLAITCDYQIIDEVVAALQCIRTWERKTSKRILHNYGGCYVYRKISGREDWSLHAYGRAVDINIPPNGSRLINLQHPVVVQCFKAQGFRWGGDWKYPDFMHFDMPLKSKEEI